MKRSGLVMKQLSIQLGIYLLMISCKQAVPGEKVASARFQDSLEIAETIHAFYKWHHEKTTDTINDYNFVDDSGDRYRLKLDLLQKYLDKLYLSGYLSRSFIQNEKEFYLNCEKLWQNETVGEVPSCMDGDHFFCAQEWDLNFWIHAAVTLDYLEKDSAAVRMVGSSFELPLERSFSLIREDGSWRLSVIDCDQR